MSRTIESSDLYGGRTFTAETDAPPAFAAAAPAAVAAGRPRWAAPSFDTPVTYLPEAPSINTLGTRDQILRNPQEAYTQRLLAAVPLPDPEKQRERRELRAQLLATGTD